jgi:phage shock protein A
LQRWRGSQQAQQIRENIRFIAGRMQENRALIKKLQKQLQESNFNGDQLKKTIASMLKQLDEKDQQLQQLRAPNSMPRIFISLNSTRQSITSTAIVSD